jgi:hypothetical protein
MSMMSLERVIEAVGEDGRIGFCLKCGHEQGGCEPNAQNYKCESCGEHEVFGAERILMMGAGAPLQAVRAAGGVGTA